MLKQFKSLFEGVAARMVKERRSVDSAHVNLIRLKDLGRSAKMSRRCGCMPISIDVTELSEVGKYASVFLHLSFSRSYDSGNLKKRAKTG